MPARRLLLLLGGPAATAQLVGPGALVPGGGPQNNRRSGGWGVVDQWPVGFFVGGSDLEQMNGIYLRQRDLDHTLPHYCELSWKHIDNHFKVASTDVRGWAGVKGAEKEWLWIDEQGRDLLAQPGKHYIPGNARQWVPVARTFHYWNKGDRAETFAAEAGWWEAGEQGRIISNNMDDKERPILWERTRDGRRLNMGAWRLRPVAGASKERRVADEDDAYGDAYRPWQVVAIMSRDRLDELIQQKRRHDEDVKKARRRGGGAVVDEAGVFPQASSHLLGGTNASEGTAVLDDGAVLHAMRSCRDGHHEAVEQARACLAQGLRDARSAVSYCLRRAGDPGKALEVSNAGDEASSKLERALAMFDLHRPCGTLQALEKAYELDRALPGLGAWMLLGRVRAKAVGCGANIGDTGFRVGDVVRAREDLRGFWAQGDAGDVIGLAAASNPVAVQMRSFRQKLVDTTPDRLERVGFDAKTTFDDVYATLDVACDFTPDELRRAYRSASRECHPDKGGDTNDFTRVGRAHEILSDPSKRAAWDAGAEVVDRPQDFPLKDELVSYYWPELRPFTPFGDVSEHRRAFEKLDAEKRAKKAPPVAPAKRAAPAKGAAAPPEPPKGGWGWPWS